MADLKVKLDHGEMQDLLEGPEVKSPLMEIANAKAARARSTAPVASGEYRDSISVEVDETDRTAVRVVAHAPHSVVVEAKTGNLKRALGG